MSKEKQVNLCEGCHRPIESNIYACDDCVANLDIDLHMCPEFRKDKARIKELEEKLSLSLSLYEWRDIKDAPRDGTEIFALEDNNQFLAFYDRQNHGWWSLSGTLPVDEIHPDKWCHTPPSTQEGEK